MLVIIIITFIIIAFFLSIFVGVILDTEFAASYIITLILLAPLGIKIYNNNKDNEYSLHNTNMKNKNKFSSKLKKALKNCRNSFKKLKSKKKKQSSKRKFRTKKYSFRVAGVTKENDIGLSIPKLLESYLEDYMIKTYAEKYDSITNKDIKELDIKVFEYQPVRTIFKLVPEPDNPYDKNAIKVVHEEIGHVGYVPKNKTREVKELLANDPLIKGVIRGGNFKYLDYETTRVKKEFSNYNIVIEILY